MQLSVFTCGDKWKSKFILKNAASKPKRCVKKMKRAFLRNAEIENVAHRVAVETADARAMPFADESFDIVLSSWVLHNIVRRKERKKALAEMARVLKPNGEIVIADVWLGFEYAAFFRKNDFACVSVSRPYFLFFAPTFVMRAAKAKR